jgi:hypothetical protein
MIITNWEPVQDTSRPTAGEFFPATGVVFTSAMCYRLHPGFDPALMNIFLFRYERRF